MPNNTRSKAPETHRASNFERRLKKTMNSESDPEMFTPNTAGAEELTSYTENFPLVEDFNQTNMRSKSGQRQRTNSGKDNE